MADSKSTGAVKLVNDQLGQLRLRSATRCTSQTLDQSGRVMGHIDPIRRTDDRRFARSLGRRQKRPYLICTSKDGSMAAGP